MPKIIDFLSKTLPFERDKLVEISKENLQKIGERYAHEHNIWAIETQSWISENGRNEAPFRWDTRYSKSQSIMVYIN